MIFSTFSSSEQDTATSANKSSGFISGTIRWGFVAALIRALPVVITQQLQQAVIDISNTTSADSHLCLHPQLTPKAMVICKSRKLKCNQISFPLQYRESRCMCHCFHWILFRWYEKNAFFFKLSNYLNKEFSTQLHTIFLCPYAI